MVTYNSLENISNSLNYSDTLLNMCQLLVATICHGKKKERKKESYNHSIP